LVSEQVVLVVQVVLEEHQTVVLELLAVLEAQGAS